jgi:hypothetical protein
MTRFSRYSPEVETVTDLATGEVVFYAGREWKVGKVETSSTPPCAVLVSKTGRYSEPVYPLNIKPGYGRPLRRVLKPSW